MRYSIPEQNIESLEKKMIRIRNKCAKYGCEFHYERVGEHVEVKKYFDEETGERYQVPIRFIDVECEGEAKINGWKYVASLEYTSKGNVIKGVPGVEIPKRFYDCEPWCEHCKTKRDRRESFVVFNEETGEFKQVGRGCLKDFTGGMSAESAAVFESFLKYIEEAEKWDGGGWRSPYYKVDDFMVCVAEVVRLYGYAKNDGYNLSTVDRARECYGMENNFRVVESGRKRYQEAVSKGFDVKRPESIELAKAVREWIVNNENDTNYFHNLKVACSLEWADWGKTGILASAFPSYNVELEIQAEKRKREAELAAKVAKSGYVGEVGKRISFKPVIAVCLTSWETMYGTTYVFKFEDEDGHEFTWKTGSWVDTGKQMKKLTGTVKEHKEYRGVKQTELTRCKIEYQEVD